MNKVGENKMPENKMPEIEPLKELKNALLTIKNHCLVQKDCIQGDEKCSLWTICSMEWNQSPCFWKLNSLNNTDN